MLLSLRDENGDFTVEAPRVMAPHIPLRDGKALAICGPEGSGTGMLAEGIAACSEVPYSCISTAILKSNYKLSGIMTAHAPGILIVDIDDVDDLTERDIFTLKHMVTHKIAHFIRPGVARFTMPSPRIIIVSYALGDVWRESSIGPWADILELL